MDLGGCQNIARFQCSFFTILDICQYRIVYLFSTSLRENCNRAFFSL